MTKKERIKALERRVADLEAMQELLEPVATEHGILMRRMNGAELVAQRVMLETRRVDTINAEQRDT